MFNTNKINLRIQKYQLIDKFPEISDTVPEWLPVRLRENDFGKEGSTPIPSVKAARSAKY